MTVSIFKGFGVGLQLYTIRDAMAEDVPGSLKKVSELGFRYLELAGYEKGLFYGYEPVELKQIVNDLGMEMLSSHVMIAATINTNTLRKIAEDQEKLGVKYCIQPWVFEEDRTTLENYKMMAATWNNAGQIMKEYGIQFGYHNHNIEFEALEGKIPCYDVLMAELDADLVTMELHLF